VTAEPHDDSKQVTARVFVLELGHARPLDYALAQGTHELKDLGVLLSLEGQEIGVSWLGHGPRAFLLPGARQLQKGQWQTAEDRARISWAGRDWLLLAHALPGDAAVPERGLCLNAHGLGFPMAALLVAEQGPERGHFWRFRTSPTDVARGVKIVAVQPRDRSGRTLPGAETLHLRVATDAPPVTLDGQSVTPGSDVLLPADATLTLQSHDDTPGLRAHVLLARP
jgi:hypothetical protein